MDINNEKRLIASEIIVNLHCANQYKQLQILKDQIDYSLNQLDKGKVMSKGTQTDKI